MLVLAEIKTSDVTLLKTLIFYINMFCIGFTMLTALTKNNFI